MQIVPGQIKSWFYYQKSTKTTKNVPFALWITALRKPPGPAPKRLTPYHFYMRHPDHEQKVSDVFDATWPATGKDHSYTLAFRCDIAKELLAAETDEVRDQLEREGIEHHRKALEEHSVALQAKPSDKPEHQQQACDLLATVVQPLLDGIRAYTGYQVWMMAGAPPEAPGGNFVTVVLHSGKTAEAVPRSFAEWDREGFMKNVVKQFTCYLVETIPKTDGVQADLTNLEAVCITTNSTGDTATTVLRPFLAPVPPAEPPAEQLQKAPI
ncbi:hypothetical protein PILCRDRAFT_9622 [Piloderma croceum F 1598]|uniref:Uncharacterized protein n=1 Tax=Piloderma croceum (strain F 1598) TaxID=765440 RepID=A0A0C3F6Y0_PILCF|nr:hypothetical protein PILCRDRAFT_9622 [Piloderma croceum F 1598]